MKEGDPRTPQAELIGALLDNTIDAAQFAELRELLISDPRAMDLYLDQVFLDAALRESGVGEPQLADLDDDRGGGAADVRSPSLHDGMVLPAIRREDDPDESDDATSAPATPWRPYRPPAKRKVGRPIAIAASLLILGSVVGGLLWRPRVPEVAALGRQVQVRWGTPDFRPETGLRLTDGVVLVLEAGLAELKFDGGAVVIMEGPARFTLRDGGVEMASGRLSAMVPPAARGFTVRTPAAVFVDLGTAFGVAAGSDRSARLHVFQGSVRATPAIAPSAAQTLTAGQAAEAAPGSTVLFVAPASGNEFVRDLADPRVSIALHGTGFRVDRARPDPRWQLVSRTDVPAWTPQPAIVSPATPAAYRPGDRERAQWVTVPDAPTSPPSGTYTFATTVDLTGLRPETAVIEARVCVDNAIQEVRVNGRVVDVGLGAATARSGDHLSRPMTLTLREGFTIGANTVEFVVLNGGSASGKKSSAMSLQVEWTGTALRQF